MVFDLNLKQSKDFEEYFATEEVTDCVSALVDYINAYYSEMNRTGRINLYRNSYYKFYQGFILKGAIYSSGQEGELKNTFVNHFANLITHQVNMVCQQKLSYEPQATVGDSEAQEQIKLAKGILYAYSNRSDFDLDGLLRDCTEQSRIFGESHVSVLWKKSLGRTIAYRESTDDDGQNQKEEIKEGENEIEVWSPFDIIIDTTLTNHKMHCWKILRKWENKYEVAHEYPDWAEDVISLYSGSSLGDTQLSYRITDTSDVIPVYYFFHKKTAAVPEGRFIKFIDDRIILADGKLPYREIPLYRMFTRELWGSPYGYSSGFDLLPIQEVTDRLNSAIITNQITFATQNIAIARNSNISWENLYGGLNIIEWDTTVGPNGKPEALQLTSSPPEVFNYLKQCVADMGTIAGINEVVRGNPDLTLKGQVSGEALAMMTANSIQFNSDLQKAYIRLAEQVGTALIHNIQDFGFMEMKKGQFTKRKGMNLSANNTYVESEYSKPELEKVDKIVIRYGNPLSQTTSGRLAIADSLIQKGMITKPQEYFEVLETGDLEPLLQSEESQIHLVREQCEMLRDGQKCQVLKYDNHPLCIMEALAILSSVSARENPQVILAVQDYVEQHRQLWKQISVEAPEILGLMKIPPLFPAQPQPNNAPLPQTGQPAPASRVPLNGAGPISKIPLPMGAS